MQCLYYMAVKISAQKLPCFTTSSGKILSKITLFIGFFNYIFPYHIDHVKRFAAGKVKAESQINNRSDNKRFITSFYFGSKF